MSVGKYFVLSTFHYSTNKQQPQQFNNTRNTASRSPSDYLDRSIHVPPDPLISHQSDAATATTGGPSYQTRHSSSSPQQQQLVFITPRKTRAPSSPSTATKRVGRAHTSLSSPSRSHRHLHVADRNRGTAPAAPRCAPSNTA